MLKRTYITIAATISAMTLAATAGAQVLIGGFQGASDPTDAGWVDTQTGTAVPITSDSNASFTALGVPGDPLSLELTGAGGFGKPSSLELSLTATQIQALLTNSWLTFTFSVPTGGATAGYSQIYNVQFQFAGAPSGYTNWMSGGSAAATWGTYSQAEGSTNNNSGGEPNYYFYSGEPALFSQTVTINYAPLTNAIATGGAGYVNIVFQGNTGGGAPAIQAFNNVVLSTTPFGQGPSANVFTVDDFSTNGVGPENPTNDDYYTATNVYELGEITNVWANWFGGAFSSVQFSTNSTGSSPANGSLQINLNWTAGSQFVVWEQGPNNNDYSIPGVSSLTYTSLEMDVKWDASSVAFAGQQSYTNYGPLRFGERDSGYGQDWLLTTNIPVSDTNWVHIVVPLTASNPLQNGQTSTFDGILIGADTASYANSQFVGSAILYVDNVEFKGPIQSAAVPAPKLTIQPASPGLRIYAGSTVNTYDREDLVTVDQNMSWVSASTYPVTYSFSLLSYPNNNINQTMLELIPVNTLNGNATYGQEYGDYQAGNGLWLVLAPNGGGAVTASVEWKTNDFGANPGITGSSTNYNNPNYLALRITNSTAIGTWTLSFNSPSTGTLTPPGGTPQSFTVADPTVASDFANPVIAQFGLQPNSTAGEGLYETWGFIGITNVADGNEYEDFTHESSDLTLNQVTSYPTTPSGFFETANSANQASSIIIRTNADLDWVTWTTPALGYNLVAGTNLQLSPLTHWVTPDYFSSGNDDIAPRGAPVLEGTTEVEVIPADNAPTANGQPGGPLSPTAFFELTTNTPASSP